MKNRKKPKISKVVEYLNNHLRDGNDKTVRYWLEDYLSSSYKLPGNFDDRYLHCSFFKITTIILYYCIISIFIFLNSLYNNITKGRLLLWSLLKKV